MFDNFLLIFYEISFYWTVCLFSKNIIVCCDEDIGWWYLENNFWENYSQYCHLLQKDSKNMFYFCLLFLLFLYASIKLWSNLRLMTKFSFQRLGNFYKILSLQNFFQFFSIKLFLFFIFLFSCLIIYWSKEY